METHRRWYCRECKREWLEPSACYANSAPCSITGNPINGPNCPVCGSPEIELVEYKPEFPGGDIPRDRINKVIPQEVISVIPGNTAVNNYSIRNEPLLGRDAKELITTNLKLIESRKDNNIYEIGPGNEFNNNEIYDLSDMD